MTDEAELRIAKGLPNGWEGFVLKTICKKPWLAILVKDKTMIRERGMTSAEALSKAKKKVTARLTADFHKNQLSFLLPVFHHRLAIMPSETEGSDAVGANRFLGR